MSKLSTCPSTLLDQAGATPGIDRVASDKVVERALAKDQLLRPSQHQNLRQLAGDLYEGRFAWQCTPIRLNVELHERCNESCAFCDLPRGGGNELSLTVLERVLDELGHGLIEVMPLLGSEPTLGPLAQVADLLRPHNVFLHLITNGVLMTPKLTDAVADITSRIQFSLPSHREGAYRAVMPKSDRARVLANLDHALKVGRETGTQVVVSTVPTVHNLLHLDEWVHFLADRGVERIIVSKLFEGTARYDELAAEVLIDPSASADAYESILAAAIERGCFMETCADALVGRRELPAAPSNRFNLLFETSSLADLYRPGFCLPTATTAFIQADGTVQPCVRDRIELGQLPAAPVAPVAPNVPVVPIDFASIWNGPEMQQHRRSLLVGPPNPRCVACSNYFNGHP